MLITEILIVIALIAVNGLLAMSELAVVSSRPTRLKAMVAQKVRGARRALVLAEDPGRFLSTVQIGITLIGILAGAFSGATIGDRFTNWLLAQELSESIAAPLAVGVVVTIITYFSLIVGELVPKQIALRRPEVIACAVAPAMTHFARISFPLVWLLDQSSKVLLAILGQRSVAENTVSEEEIRTLVAEAESSGILTAEERSMISGVMRLGDRPVRAVMTPRLQVDHIDLADGTDINRKRILESPHSRLPVCDGSLDIVIGVIQAKDVADEYLKGNTATDWRSLVRTAPIIPETMDAHDVVAVLKESPVHIGLVHDEYGHFEGVVTSADILESIVGEFHSGTEEPAPDIVEREDGSALVEGSMPADEFAEAFHIALPDGDYHTVAGLMLVLFRKLPGVGESIEAHGCKFEIVDLDGRRIDKVLVTKL